MLEENLPKKRAPLRKRILRVVVPLLVGALLASGLEGSHQCANLLIKLFA